MKLVINSLPAPGSRLPAPGSRLPVIIALISLGLIASCKMSTTPQNNRSTFRYATMRSGAMLAWDETEIDSTVLPSSMSSATNAAKRDYCNPQTSKYHVNITVPDTAVHFFRTERLTYQLHDEDSAMDEAWRVWRSISYGTSYIAYNDSGNVVRNLTIPLDAEFHDNIDVLPLVSYWDTVTDSARSAYKTAASTAGFSVDDETNGIHLDRTFTFEGHTYDGKLILGHTFLELIQGETYNGSTLISRQDYSYSSSGNGGIIATKIVSTTPVVVDASSSFTKQRIQLLSNFTLP